MGSSSEDDPLPEDDSFLANLSQRLDNVSSDALLEDSFSELAGVVSSTPASKRPSQTRQRKSPAKSAATPPGSPASRTRSRVATQSGRNSPDSPARRTRSRTRTDSPIQENRRPSTPDSPASRTRTRTRVDSRNVVIATPHSPASRTRTQVDSRNVVIATPTTRSTPGTAKASTPVEKGKMKCPKCPNVLSNKRYLDIHLRGHMMTGVISRAPSTQDLTEAMPTMFNTVLSELIQEPVIGDLSLLCHDYLVTLQKKFPEDTSGEAAEIISLLTASFSEIFQQKKALFPSSIKSSMYVGVNKLLSSSEFCEKIIGNLTVICESEYSVLNTVVGSIMLLLTSKVIVFAVQKMRGVEGPSVSVRMKRSSDKIDSSEFRELTYHIGGSIVHGFLWKGVQYSEESQIWTSFCEVLRQKFMRNKDKTNECSADIRNHTEKKNRGGLIDISDAAFEFFLVLFDFLMSLEADNGTLPDDVTDNYVLQHDVLLCLWDVLVGDDLKESDSLDLLIQITHSCVRVVMRGIMKRRLNKILQKAYSSVAHRARLAK